MIQNLFFLKQKYELINFFAFQLQSFLDQTQNIQHSAFASLYFSKSFLFHLCRKETYYPPNHQCIKSSFFLFDRYLHKIYLQYNMLFMIF